MTGARHAQIAHGHAAILDRRRQVFQIRLQFMIFSQIDERVDAGLEVRRQLDARFLRVMGERIFSGEETVRYNPVRIRVRTRGAAGRKWQIGHGVNG